MTFRIKLDHENENWLRTIKLARLRAGGWKGTIAEYHRELRRGMDAGEDPAALSRRLLPDAPRPPDEQDADEGGKP